MIHLYQTSRQLRVAADAVLGPPQERYIFVDANKTSVVRRVTLHKHPRNSLISNALRGGRIGFASAKLIRNDSANQLVRFSETYSWAYELLRDLPSSPLRFCDSQLEESFQPFGSALPSLTPHYFLSRVS